jgi:hypothetical protein
MLLPSLGPLRLCRTKLMFRNHPGMRIFELFSSLYLPMPFDSSQPFPSGALRCSGALRWCTSFEILISTHCGQDRVKRSLEPKPNYELRFDGHNVMTPSAGKLILRKHGAQLVIDVTNGRATLPVQMSQLGGELEALFLAEDGGVQTSTFTISPPGPCHKLKCLICLNAFKHIGCLPPALAYTIYAGLTLLTMSLILYCRAIIHLVIGVASSVLQLARGFMRLVKALLRGALRLGRMFGLALRMGARRALHRVNQMDLELRAGIGLPLVLLLILPLVLGDNDPSSPWTTFPSS